MKQAGYIDIKNKNEPKPAWNKFANDIASEFERRVAKLEGVELDEAIQYFLNEPPKKQILRDGQLDWRDIPYDGGPLLKWLIDAIKRVRNNLFHGGKYPYSDLEEPARNSLLLNHSLTVLQECLVLCGSEGFTEGTVRNKTLRVRESFLDSID